MNRFSFLLLATAAVPLIADAVPPDSTTQISQQILARYFAAVNTQSPKTRGVDMDMHFSARLPRMKKEGVMLAKRIVSSLGKISFVVKSFTGDNTIKTYVITKYMAGEVDLAFPTVGSVAALVKDGRLRSLGSTGRVRSPLLPQVPTLAESGYPGYQFESWLALVAPAGVPAGIMRRLGDEVRRIVAGEAMQRMFADNAITTDLILGDAAQAVVRRDFDAMGALVRKSGATAN